MSAPNFSELMNQLTNEIDSSELSISSSDSWENFDADIQAMLQRVQSESTNTQVGSTETSSSYSFSGQLPSGKKTRGRVVIPIKYLENRQSRLTTFNKRKNGLLKKMREITTLTGAEGLLVIKSETGLLTTFTTEKLRPMLSSPEGKNLFQSCLESSRNDNESVDGKGKSTPKRRVANATVNPSSVESASHAGKNPCPDPVESDARKSLTSIEVKNLLQSYLTESADHIGSVNGVVKSTSYQPPAIVESRSSSPATKMPQLSTVADIINDSGLETDVSQTESSFLDNLASVNQEIIPPWLAPFMIPEAANLELFLQPALQLPFPFALTPQQNYFQMLAAIHLLQNNQSNQPSS